jgi:hypothetical protein
LDAFEHVIPKLFIMSTGIAKATMAANVTAAAATAKEANSKLEEYIEK